MEDSYLITTETEKWTRATKKGAIGLADYLASKGTPAKVFQGGPMIYETIRVEDEFQMGAD